MTGRHVGLTAALESAGLCALSGCATMTPESAAAVVLLKERPSLIVAPLSMQIN